jgi:hypothetical protein
VHLGEGPQRRSRVLQFGIGRMGLEGMNGVVVRWIDGADGAPTAAKVSSPFGVTPERSPTN